MATDPLNPTLDTTRKPSVATVDRRYRQPAVIPDNIPDDVEVAETETAQPVPQPVRRARSFAPPDPSTEPETGTTGGYIPKQAGTWDGKAITTADLSGDPATRMEQIRQETERRARLQFEKERPFAPSGEFKGPTTRAIRDASIEGEQAYGDLQQQRRQQIADRREQMRFDQKTRNATKEEQFRSTGQQFYKDEFSELQPVLEAGTNRPLFSTTPKTLTKHPKTGEPVMEMRDKYGQRQYSRPKLVASDDPLDDRLYYDVGDGESIPAMTIDEAANHPDVSVAVRGKAARKRKMTAERNAATAAMKIDADRISMQYDTAKMQLAAMKSRADALALQGGNPEEIAKLTDQAMALEDNLKPGQGALALQKEMADRALAKELTKTKYDAYLLQKDEMATRLISQGKDPEQDPLYRDNEKKLQEFKEGLIETEKREAEIARLMQPLTGAPVAPAPTEATFGQKAATVGANVLEGAGTGLVDMGEFVVRQLGRLGRLMQYGSPEMEKAGVQPPGMEVAAEWANAMREVASEWGPEVTPEIRAQLEKGFLTGTAPKALGSAISFMLPTGLLGGAAKALNLSTKAMGGLAAAGVATAGAAGSGNAFRREAEAKLRPKLAKGEITQQDFERSLGMAEAFGAALGTTEAVPLGKFVQRIGGTVAGKGFLAKLFEKAARGGNGAAMKWLAGEGGEVLAETIEEGGQELVQSLSEDIYASQTFDPERKIGADTAESAAAGGLVGFLLSLTTRLIGGRRLPPPAQPEGEQTPPPPGTATAPAGTPPEGAATPSQNFPTADQTEAERAQAELEAALVENQAAAEMAVAQGETAPVEAVDAGTTAEPAAVEPQEAAPTAETAPVAEAPVEPVPVGQIQEPTPPGAPEAQPVAIPAPEEQQPIQTEETSNAATQGQQPANNQQQYPGTAQGTAVQENRPEVRQAEGEQAGGGNRVVGSEAGAAPAVRPEVEQFTPPYPPRDGGGYSAIILSDGTAVIGGRNHPETIKKGQELGLITDQNLPSAKAGFVRPDGTGFDVSDGKPIAIKKTQWLDKISPPAPKRTIEQVKAERAQKGLGEPIAKQEAVAPETFEQKNDRLMREQNERIEKDMLSRPVLEQDPDFWVRKEVERMALKEGLSLQESREMHRENLRKMILNGINRQVYTKRPIHANAVSEHFLKKVPSGYVLKGDTYVYSKPAKQAAPAAPQVPSESRGKYDEDYDKMRTDARGLVRRWVNEGILRGFKTGRFGRKDLMITKPSPADGKDVLFRITSLGSDNQPFGHLEVTETIWDEWKKNPDKYRQTELGELLDAAAETVRPDLIRGITGVTLDEKYEYQYKLRNRDVGVGTAPKGFIRASGRDVWYSQPLTSKELYDYEIDPVDATPVKTAASESTLGDQPVKLELRRSKTGEMVEVEMSAKQAESRVQKHIDTLTQVRNCLEGIAA